MRKHDESREGLKRGSGGAVFTLQCASSAILPLLALCLPLGAAEPTFNGDRAFGDLRHLVDFGPRPSGSKALDETRQWMIRQIEQADLHADEDSFLASTPVGNVPMTNLIVKIPGQTSQLVIVAGHYDTKRFDDFKFVGANDGGSSAALLLEMARALAHRKFKFTVWLVFFDGEEAVQQWSGTDSLYGSRHLAETLTASGDLGRIGALILVDMIGDAKLTIYRDANSTSWLNDIIFGTARRLGFGKNFQNEKEAYQDDHIPFVNAGAAAVDLLGNVGPTSTSAPFGSYWHTARDTIDKCAPTSLATVGRVVLASLDELEKSPHMK